MNCRLRMGCLPAEDPHTSRTGSRRPEPVLNNPEAQHRQLTVCPRPTGPLRLSRRDGPLADLNAEHHRRAYALASADAIMPGSKSGLDQRFFLKFKFEDAGVDLTRAAVSFGGGQRIGQDRQPLDLLIQASAGRRPAPWASRCRGFRPAPAMMALRVSTLPRSSIVGAQRRRSHLHQFALRRSQLASHPCVASNTVSPVRI